MKTGTMRVPRKRTRDQVARLTYLYRALMARRCWRNRSLRDFDGATTCSPGIDYWVYR